jgi:cobalamin biosynthesis Mg chelatase CobN
MAVTTNPSALGAAIRDFGPSYYVGAASVGAAPPTTAAVSLGEVAAKMKGEKTTQSVRTYTNADVQRINENMRLQGVNVNARLQQSAEPANSGVTVANGQSASSATQVANEPAAPAQNQPQLSASARPSPAIREEQAQSASASPAPETAQSAQESSATTPQVNQPKPGNQSEQQPSRQLPATSTLLPLLGIIGLASGGIGLVFRKYRK